jgi:hypothetical protein
MGGEVFALAALISAKAFLAVRDVRWISGAGFADSSYVSRAFRRMFRIAADALR